MHDARIGAELGHLARRAVVESNSDGDQQIRLFQSQVDARRAVHAQHAQVQRIAGGKSAQAHQRRDDGDPVFARQTPQISGAFRGDYTAADVEDRPFGGFDHRRHAPQRLLGDGRRSGPPPWIGPPLEVDRLILHVLGHVHHDRSGAPRIGDLEGERQNLEQFGGGADEKIVLGDRQRQPIGVHFLEGVGADQRRRDLARDRHDRNRIQFGVGDRRQQVGRARAGGAQANGGPPRDAGDALGDESGALFVPCQDMPDRARMQRVV
ncbi:MAG: hypothetical protein BWZ10_03478 [candidate division BRC1 bacterium ADurb.BinA364]|nr:MAG: hypothetical protein BWZ10_03478 [candidate division BRC1 bacterium ADurb.BinA364]